MVFEDRQEAAIKLYKLLQKKPPFKNRDKIVLISLLRGGVILGSFLAKKLECVHLPLVVTKIPAPHNSELAIGALCFEITYLETHIIKSLRLNKQDLARHIKITEHKFIQSCRQFNLNEELYDEIKDKIVVLADDGVATGASVRAALLFLKTKKPKKVILATPIAAASTDLGDFDKVYVLDRPYNFGAVSQYYKRFPQLEDKEVKEAIRLSVFPHRKRSL